MKEAWTTKRINWLMVGFCIVALVSGCVPTAKYTAPTVVLNEPDNSRILNKSYDETWKNLIQYAGGSFYAIDNFEKESGLMTLSFGAVNPREYISGGEWEIAIPQRKFKGDYVDYCCRFLNGRLNGKMNIVVMEQGAENTKVTVNSRYVFQFDYIDANGRYHGSETVSFDSGRCGTFYPKNAAKGIPSSRTICPTGRAESTIINAIESF